MAKYMCVKNVKYNDGRDWGPQQVLFDTQLSSKKWKADLGESTLYLSSKGNYFLVNDPNTYYVSPSKAAVWLLYNKHQLPEELKGYEEEVVE